jgi:hypothetical protein
MSDLLSAADLVAQRGGALPFKTVNGGNTYGYNNTLIEAATPSPDRKQTTLVDYDLHRTISVQGRRLLLSMARVIFWKFPAIQAGILEQANLATSVFTPRFAGKNKEWGDAAHDWLHEWHQVFDISGWPYDDESYRELLLVACIVDGEMGTLLTQDSAGNPRLQIIPSHRIGSRYQTGGSAQIRYVPNTISPIGPLSPIGPTSSLFIDNILVDDALPFELSAVWEAPLIDGVIVDDQARAIAYRVYDDPTVSSIHRDISARNMFLSFFPMFPGQLRGISLLASSVPICEDVSEWKSLEMLAQKIFSSRAIVEENETGDIDQAKQLVSSAQFSQPAIGPDGKPIPGQTQQKLSPDLVKTEGGTYTVFRAKTGSKLTALEWSRPSQGAQDFQETMLRDAFRGTEWDIFFSLDPKSVGGAPMRVIVDKINRVLKKRRRLAGKAMKRIDTYGLAKGALRTGELPMDPEWYKWHYQGPPDITADRRYEAQTDQMEYDAGWSTLEDIEKKRNGDWRLKREQREIEVEDKLARAKKLADKYGISIQEALLELGKVGQATFSYKEQEEDAPQPQQPQGNPAPQPDAA